MFRNDRKRPAVKQVEVLSVHKLVRKCVVNSVEHTTSTNNVTFRRHKHSERRCRSEMVKDGRYNLLYIQS